MDSADALIKSCKVRSFIIIYILTMIRTERSDLGKRERSVRIRPERKGKSPLCLLVRQANMPCAMTLN